jgi:hypothetical protein
VSISSSEERKKQCLSKDQQRLDDEASRENARWDDCVIIDLIKLRWDSNKHLCDAGASTSQQEQCSSLRVDRGRRIALNEMTWEQHTD